jgi:perosamine synthetase
MVPAKKPPKRAQPPETMRRIPVGDADIGEREIASVTDCLRSGWVSSIGPYVSRFEEAFAAYCGCRFGVSTCNGTAALHLALLALGIGPGDEVLVPTLTFVSTANAVVYTGATPVLVDADPDTWNLDVDDARRKVTARTKAVIAVHVFGNPVDMDAVAALSADHGLAVIEDAAEAHGARWRGRRVGGLGDVGCFSFFGNKLLTTGEGGMVVTNRPDIAAAARKWGNLSRPEGQHYFHDAVGFNYRMASLPAALGLAQLDRIDELLARKIRNAERYREHLAAVPGLQLPSVAGPAESAWWMFGVLVDDGFGIDREALAGRLREDGIDTRPFFVPLHELPPFSKSQPCPVAASLSRRGLVLPSGTRLTDEEIADISRVVSAAGAAR